MEKISVVIPLYNKEKHIARAISSVLSQTCVPFEIIVVDDGSTDRGTEVVESIGDARIRLIRKPNGGVSSARNRGIEEAQGELIAFLDSDDAWKPEFLESILRLRSRFPRAGAYGTAYETFDGKVYRSVAYWGIPENDQDVIIPNFFESMHGQPPLWASAIAIPKAVLQDVGGFKTGEVVAEDVELWCRIALKYDIAFTKQLCATYYQDADNRVYVRGKKHKKPIGYMDTLDQALLDPNLKESFKRPLAVLREMVELGEVTSYLFAGMGKQAREVYRHCSWRYLKKQALMWYTLSWLPPSFSEWLMGLKRKLTGK